MEKIVYHYYVFNLEASTLGFRFSTVNQIFPKPNCFLNLLDTIKVKKNANLCSTIY